MKAHFIHKIVLCSLLVLILPVPARAADPLPSWNDGAARQMILEFVKATTDKNSADYVSPEERIATFDQDDTLWVEHPMYSQVVYCLERVPAVVKAEAIKSSLNIDKQEELQKILG